MLLISSIRSTCPAHLIILDFITRTILDEEYRSLSFSLCSFLYFLVTPSLLGRNILLSILLSNTFSLCSSLNVGEQDVVLMLVYAVPIFIIVALMAIPT